MYVSLQEVAGVGPRATSSRASVGSGGDGETGTVILDISDRLVSAIVQPGQNKTKKTVKSPTVGKRCSSSFIVDFTLCPLGGYKMKLQFVC